MGTSSEMAGVKKYIKYPDAFVLKIPKNISSTLRIALRYTSVSKVYSDAHWSVLEIFLGILSTTSYGFEHYLFANLL